MLDDESRGGCEFCGWAIEKGDYDGSLTGAFEDSEVHPGHRWPSQLEFAISNVGNFACIQCSGTFSSRIRADRERLPELPAVYGQRFFARLREFLPHARLIKFTGGEPFLIEGNFRIWDMLAGGRRSPRPWILTNGSQWNERVERALADAGGLAEVWLLWAEALTGCAEAWARSSVPAQDAEEGPPAAAVPRDGGERRVAPAPAAVTTRTHPARLPGGPAEARSRRGELELQSSVSTENGGSDMRALSTLLLACAIPTASAGAQNFVTNGDFSGATIAPWTASGPAIGPGLITFDTDGTGASQGYGARPGGPVAHRLDQPINWLPIAYELTLDVAHLPPVLSSSLQLGRIDVFAANQVVASMPFTVSRLRRTVQRARLCARFKPATTGRGTIGVALSYPGTATTRSPQLIFDNVDLRPARNAQFCIIGDRILGQSVSFEVTGEASAGFLVLLSPALLPAPIKIPGVGGEFALGLQVLIPFLQGALDGSGQFKQTLTIPNLPIGGTKLYWQALQVATSGPSLGWHSQQGFYQ